MAVKKKAAPVKKVAASKPKSQPQPVVYELGPGTKDFLIGLLAGFTTLVQRVLTVVPASQDAKPEPKPDPKPVAAPKPAAESTNPNLLTKIRETINQKSEEGKTQKIVKLLGEFGAKNASSLDADKYEDFLERLQDL